MWAGQQLIQEYIVIMLNYFQLVLINLLFCGRSIDPRARSTIKFEASIVCCSMAVLMKELQKFCLFQHRFTHKLICLMMNFDLHKVSSENDTFVHRRSETLSSNTLKKMRWEHAGEQRSKMRINFQHFVFKSVVYQRLDSFTKSIHFN